MQAAATKKKAAANGGELIPGTDALKGPRSILPNGKGMRILAPATVLLRERFETEGAFVPLDAITKETRARGIGAS